MSARRDPRPSRSRERERDGEMVRWWPVPLSVVQEPTPHAARPLDRRGARPRVETARRDEWDTARSLAPPPREWCASHLARSRTTTANKRRERHRRDASRAVVGRRLSSSRSRRSNVERPEPLPLPSFAPRATEARRRRPARAARSCLDRRSVPRDRGAAPSPRFRARLTLVATRRAAATATWHVRAGSGVNRSSGLRKAMTWRDVS